MKKDRAPGHILTFYSFKGGVGRTMALANVAFLAAQNGLRVLVMDWDLEAPGLAYYFRGLLDTVSAQKLKDAPGLLNILWSWKNAIRGLDIVEVERIAAEYRSGTPFENNVIPITESEFIPAESALDFICAGSAIINTPEPISYEDALARFSWPSFLEEQAGGIVIDALRNWAKSTYDLILIDSRTGLADVAGVCTMQIPDEVALCFVLNRQNIDGVAKVAAAIRSKRAEQVKLRAIPMRVARQGTPEESDARARAIADLTRIGGFSTENAHEDLRRLGVLASENVPFYETLAPFAAENPSLDSLTLNYLQLGTELIGRSMSIPLIDIALIDKVRTRLQPKHATVDYIAKLKTSEPARAFAELQRLLTSAHEAQLDSHPPDNEYVLALIEAAFSLEAYENFEDPIALQSQAIELLRTLFAASPEIWHGELIARLEQHLTIAGPILDLDVELEILDELDGLLADNPTFTTRIKRLSFRRRVARIFSQSDNPQGAGQALSEISDLVRNLQRNVESLSSEQYDSLLAAEIDAQTIRGELTLRRNDYAQAYKEFASALEKASMLNIEIANAELRRLRSNLHLLFALSQSHNPESLDFSLHAVEAAKWAGSKSQLIPSFVELIQVLISHDDGRTLVLDFCEALFNERHSNTAQLLGSYHGRVTRRSMALLSTIHNLFRYFERFGPSKTRHVQIQLLISIDSMLKVLTRSRKTIGERQARDIVDAVELLTGAVRDTGLQWEVSNDAMDWLRSLRIKNARKSLANDSEPEQ